MLKKFLMTATMLLACTLVHAHGYEVGDLKIQHPWARATVAVAPNAGVFMTLSSVKDDQLLRVDTDIADKAEIHEMKLVDGVMRMRPISALDLPANKTVALAPGSFHIMLFGLKRQLIDGEKFPLKLTFAKGGVVTVSVKIQSQNEAASAAAHSH